MFGRFCDHLRGRGNFGTLPVVDTESTHRLTYATPPGSGWSCSKIWVFSGGLLTFSLCVTSVQSPRGFFLLAVAGYYPCDMNSERTLHTRW